MPGEPSDSLTPKFTDLVASEQAVRMEYVSRRGQVVLADGAPPVSVANPDAGNSQSAVAQSLYSAFLNLYDFSFLDSSQHHKIVGGLVCNSRHLDTQQKEALQKIFDEFAHRNYDDSGALRLSRQDAAEQLQLLYQNLGDTHHVPLFLSENARGQLLVQLGRSAKWKSVTPRGIDFARGEPTADIRQRFDNALDASDHDRYSDHFIDHPEHVVEIGGMNFPFVKIGWQTHLVTETGHLVDLTDRLKAEIEGHIRNKEPIQVEVDLGQPVPHLWHFQTVKNEDAPDAKAVARIREQLQKIENADTIDGKPIERWSGQKREEALVSMDIDLLTGLRLRSSRNEGKSDVERLSEWLETHGISGFAGLIPPQKVEQAKTVLPKIIRKRIEKCKKIAAQNGETEIYDLLEKAQGTLEVTLPRVYAISDQEFEGKRPVPSGEPKQFYMTQGPTGVGKSSLKLQARKECGAALVIASLDDAREQIDRYWLYPATDNHNDDYKSVEMFAKTIRDLTVKRAREAGNHLFIDGSGIPYENRNDKTVKAFKQKGYQTTVLDGYAPLYVAVRGDDGQSVPDDALRRLGQRLAEEKRGVPIPIVVEKHIAHPIAAHNAARDANVDRYILTDLSHKKSDSYTLAYVLPEVDEKTVHAIAKLNGKALETALKQRSLVPDYVLWPQDGDHQFDLKVIRENAKNPGHENEPPTYRVQIITDLHQYIHLVQHGILKRNSIGPQGLYDNQVHCDVEQRFMGEKGGLELLPPKGIERRQWLPYPPYLNTENPPAPQTVETHLAPATSTAKMGATPTSGGTNFVFYAGADATAMDLCLFDDKNRETRHALHKGEAVVSDDGNRILGYYWTGFSPGTQAGDLYGFRVHGPYEPLEKGNFYNPNKLLLDPAAKAVTGEIHKWDARNFPENPEDNADIMPKARVVDCEKLYHRASRVEIEAQKLAKTQDDIAKLYRTKGKRHNVLYPHAETIIHELHVENFTKLNGAIEKAEERGTYAGLAHPSTIRHLQHKGITSVELQPVGSFGSDEHLAKRGLENLWGYQPVAPHAVYTGYASTSRPEEEFMKMVRTLKAEGIETIMDVVPNHTIEGDNNGPVVNLRGMDASLYLPFDVTGCGNTLDFGHPINRRYFKEQLEHFAALGVSGFRNDLANVLGREGGKGFNRKSLMMNELRINKILQQVKLSGEPWDLHQSTSELGYTEGGKNNHVSPWDGHARDEIFATANPHYANSRSWLIGAMSGDPNRVVAAATHDGVRLYDIDKEKNNYAHKEDNRDGNEAPNWYYADEEEKLRAVCLLAALPRFCLGSVMSYQGNDQAHTMKGDTNRYCKDAEETENNKMAHIRWGDEVTQAGQFISRIESQANWFRRNHPSLMRATPFSGEPDTATDLTFGGHPMKDVTWLDPQGNDMSHRDSIHWPGPFGMLLSGDPGNSDKGEGNFTRMVRGRKHEEPLLVLVNATGEDTYFKLPDIPGVSWHRAFDSFPKGGEGQQSHDVPEGHVRLGHKTVVAFTAQRELAKDVGKWSNGEHRAYRQAEEGHAGLGA